MIAYYFPPLATSGTYRTLKFVKYLRRFGWEPVVLTVKRGFCWEGNNEALLEEIPDGVKVFRTHSFEPVNIFRKYMGRGSMFQRNTKVSIGIGKPITPRLFNKMKTFVVRFLTWFSIPDEIVGWLPFAVIKGLMLVKHEKVDIIYTTSPPYTGQMVGYLIKKFTGLPWIADFRDPWTQNMDSFDEKRGWRNRLAELMERSVLTTADKIITTTEPMRQNFLDKYPMLDKNKFIVITNGFDEDDFRDIERGQTANRFIITHTGMLYGTRSAQSFIQAIAELIKEDEQITRELSVNFVGNVGKETLQAIEKYGLGNVVRVFDCIPYKQTLQHQVNSSVLLLINHPGRIGQTQIPSKLFEYFRISKPILALVPSGASADLIATLHAGAIVHPNNVAGIKNEIIKMFSTYKKGLLHNNVDQSMLIQFRRSELTRHLSDVLNILTR